MDQLEWKIYIYIYSLKEKKWNLYFILNKKFFVSFCYCNWLVKFNWEKKFVFVTLNKWHIFEKND